MGVNESMVRTIISLCWPEYVQPKLKCISRMAKIISLLAPRSFKTGTAPIAYIVHLKTKCISSSILSNNTYKSGSNILRILRHCVRLYGGLLRSVCSPKAAIQKAVNIIYVSYSERCMMYNILLNTIL